MEVSPKRIIAASVIAALAVIGAWLAARPSLPPVPSSTATAPRTVAATIFPLYDIIRNVAGDTLKVQLILPPNAEPHTYEPTPSAMAAVRSSAVVMAIGHGLDDWIKPLADSSGVPVVTMDHGITLLPAAAGAEESSQDDDPHYWLNVTNAKIITAVVEQELATRFPEMAPVFRQNAAAYAAQLDAADAAVRSRLAGLASRDLATFHGAYNYFAAAYGLTVTGIFEPYPGREPSPQFLADLKSRLDATGTRAVYFEPSFDPAGLRTFAAENGLRIGMLDDLGGAPGRETLIDTLLFDAQSIADNQR
jgi:ABC-type Zn uptake system ZnuABC Zn-binding protein ZnuA